jgi:hypothetical protein
MPRRNQIASEELAQELYLTLFPARVRPSLHHYLHVRWCGAPDWAYAIQEAGNLLVHLLEALAAAYLYDCLKARGRKKEVTTKDVFERISHHDVVEYRHVLTEVEERVRGDDSAPKSAISIVQRHRRIADALSDPGKAPEILAPVIDRLAKPQATNRPARKVPRGRE